MSWLSHKYIGLLSSRLQQFKRKDQNSYNFRCPSCGDSKRDKLKARGWIYPKESKLLYYCFNCSISLSIGRLVKLVDPYLYEDYLKETLKEKYGDNPKREDIITDFVKKMKKPKFISNTQLKSLKKISQLPHDHAAKLYIINRKLKNFYHSQLFWADKFKAFTNSVLPNKFSSTNIDDGRIIIPFIDENNNFFGFQGRTLNKHDDLRYITIMLEDRPKVFNLNNIKKDEKVYIFEGPFDATFIPNSIAMAGGDFVNDIQKLKLDDIMIVYDNEPRNKDTIKKMEKAIANSYNICIWPDDLQHKDINDMILNNYSADKIKDMIDSSTVNGLEAQLRLSQWRKA